MKTVKNESRLTEAFSKLNQEGKKAFIPFNLLGYPDKKSCIATLKALVEGGATALELGLPFSDPMADGPLIQKASHSVLGAGFSIADAVAIIKEVRSACPHTPINLLTYFNLALSNGVESFLTRFKAAGVDAVTFVDLPLEEMEEIYGTMQNLELDSVMLISPLTPPRRIDEILKYARGFLYLVSRAGTTGMQESYSNKHEEVVKTIKERTELPVMIGFGISGAEQARNMIELGADGVIVGSKILDIIEKSALKEREKNLVSFTAAIVKSLEK
jgi:tryptophan synthase alpha chain